MFSRVARSDLATSGPGVRGSGLWGCLHLCCCFPRCHLPGGEGASGQRQVTQHLFSAASPPCILCTPNSHPMARKPQPRLRPPVWTVGPQRRHPRLRAVVWMTSTSWGRPFCSSHCPRSPSKCGGEGPPCPDPPLPRASKKRPSAGLVSEWHGQSTTACQVLLGARGTQVTRAGAGPIRQGMEHMREESMPHSHTLPQACQPLRKTQRAARKEGSEPKWVGEHELPAPRRGDQGQRDRVSELAVRDHEDPSRSCAPHLLGPDDSPLSVPSPQ